MDGLAERVRGTKSRLHVLEERPMSVADALRSTGESLRDILPQHYRHATVAIVCGRSPDEKGYVKSAYFDAEDAAKELAEARTEAATQGSGHEFQIVTATIGHLEEPVVVNPLTREFLREIDCLWVYHHLTERLR